QIAFGSLGSPLFSSIGGILFGAAVNQKAPQAALDYKHACRNRHGVKCEFVVTVRKAKT
ncbi:hypothetical protein M9458_022562, partial [Cirrhinus mrigala]